MVGFGTGLGERDWRYMRRSLRRLVVLASVFALLGATVPVATAAPPAACANRNNNTLKKLLECVDLAGVREHQAAFQAIATANGGTRASGTTGYDQSAEYVAERMEAAGYNVTIQPFDFVRFTEVSPAILEQVAPAIESGSDRQHRHDVFGHWRCDRLGDCPAGSTPRGCISRV